MFTFIGDLARRIVRRVVRIYYPRIEISGGEKIPATGPVLLAANHANSLIDPVLLGIVAQRPVHYLSKAPLFDVPVLGAILRSVGMIPAFRGSDDATQVKRNLESIGAGAEYLVKGRLIGIFPEGKSHDLPHVEQVRSGAARIAVQAAKDGARGLKIVPVGINYQRKESFRSAVWVRVGEPLDVDAALNAHPGEEKKAMRALTNDLDRGLKETVIHLDDAQWEPYLNDLEQLLPGPPQRGVGPIAALRQRKRLADAVNYFEEHFPERANAMAASIQKYRELLAAEGLEIRSPIMRFRRLRLTGQMVWEGFWLLLWFLPALFGTLHHLVPYLAIKLASGRFQQSTRATVALARLGLALPVYGLWSAGVWWAMRSYFLPWVCWAWLVAMLPVGLFALTYARRVHEGCSGWWRQMRMFYNTQQLQKLRAEQAVLRGQLQELAAEYGQAHPPETIQTIPFSWRRFAWVTVRCCLVLLLLSGAFVGATLWTSKHRASELRDPGLNLTALSTNTLTAMLTADETALRDMLGGLNDLEKRTGLMMADFESGKRSWYTQADNDAVRQLLLSYLNRRAALLRLIWKYQNSADVTDESLRLRSFLTSYTAASALFETSLKFVMLFDRSPDARRKLNEAEPLWEIPLGLYDTIRRNLVNPEHRRMLAEASKSYDAAQPEFARSDLLKGAPHDLFHATIRRSAETQTRLLAALVAADAARPWKEGKVVIGEAVYQTKTAASTWLGDAKIREPRQGKPLMQPAQLKEVRAKLQPGDIMLERRNWYLSNAFLPGYWPHAAIYIGTAEDLKRLGLDQDERVKKHWAEFVKPDQHGHERVILESISEGVVFTSFEHSVGGADSAAFLRPRLDPAHLRECIARAFSHTGKPYDFEFDFFSTDKLVCTELVFRSFDGHIQFPLVEIMGTKTMPAVELVRKFAEERGQDKASFSFVAFLDGDEQKGKARFETEEVFIKSLKRPALTWLQEASPRR